MTVFANSSAFSVACSSASNPPSERSSIFAMPPPRVVFPVPDTGVRDDAEMQIRKSFVGGRTTCSYQSR